jgi:hypothetical protein
MPNGLNNRQATSQSPASRPDVLSMHSLRWSPAPCQRRTALVSELIARPVSRHLQDPASAARAGIVRPVT